MPKPQYKRVLVKLSGEAILPKGQKYGVSIDAAVGIAAELKPVVSGGVQTALVIGGGNIFRGAEAAKSGSISQAHADTMGMLATVINGQALQEGLRQEGIEARLVTSIAMPSVAEPFTRQGALHHLESGRVLIVAGGTGRPFFSTDTAAALAALETDCEVILKATKVDGVYSADPMQNKRAEKFDRLCYLDVIKKQLKVMDSTAITMCMDHKLPIVVFNFFEAGNLKRVIGGENIGTVVYG